MEKKDYYDIKLPEEPKEKVRMRFAPNPNGAATLGSARGIIINSYLAKKYNGDFILRFDDTDPKTKPPLIEAYKWFLEDCEFLNSMPNEVYSASERIFLYYPYAEQLIQLEKAYVCLCEKEEFKKLKDTKKECPHRETKKEENLKNWKKMFSQYKEGEAVLRIKTNIKHKDPALRDWVAFRILDVEHPKVHDRYRIWPTLDFESAIEDFLLKITHIIRGKELRDSEGRQKFIYNYFNWNYPRVIHWGRVKIKEFGKLSTSIIKKGISEGLYEGWDDPQLPTIRALRRRGISPEAIRNLILSLGINENDIALSLENLYSENRKIIDAKVNRYSFIEEPFKLIVFGAKPTKVKIPLHPSFKEERGYREFNLNFNEKVELLIEKKDADKLKIGEEIRLMNLFNVRIESKSSDAITAKYLPEKNLHVNKIHWLSVRENIKAEILMPSHEIVKGFCEQSCKNLNLGEVVQFERFGFVKLEEKKNEILKFCFGHK